MAGAKRTAERWERIDDIHAQLMDAKKDLTADFKSGRIDVHAWAMGHARIDARLNRLGRIAEAE